MNVNQLSSSSAQLKIDAHSKARQLLEGSIVLAKRDISSNRRSPAFTPLRYVWRLAAMYHLCHPTPELMKQAAQRFASAGRWKEARWAAKKAIEEKNHDQLALLDIESSGYDAETLTKVIIPSAAASLVDYFTRSVQASNPIGCIGYCYAMERIALGIAGNYIKKVELMLPPGTHTTQCLQVHSSIGSDPKHVEETVDMVSQLPFEQQELVAKASYETALLCFSPPKESYVSEEELQNRLRPFKRA